VIKTQKPAYTPTVKYSLTSKAINDYELNHNQCRNVGDKYYAIYINPYTNERLLSALPILTSISELDNGIYIFVVLSLDDAPPQIYFIKTLNTYEIGSKHQQLIQRLSCINNTCKKYKLYYAGEIQKRDGRIGFNFYSGTFKMETKVKQRTLPNDIEYMTEMLNATSTGYNIQFSDEPFITRDAFADLTHADIDFYKSMGATVYEYDTRAECMAHLSYFSVHPSMAPMPGKFLHNILTTVAKPYGGGRIQQNIRTRKRKNRNKNIRTRIRKT